MPKLERTTACSGCPFRRDSIRGWLGSETDPQAFVDGALCDHDDYPLPCHMEIDYSDPNWRETQLPQAPLCAGALVMCANNCKLPHDPERAALVMAVKRSDGVFRRGGEFISHHTTD